MGSLRRTIKLPATADLEGVSATSHDGVLTVTVPKKSPEAASGKKTVVVK